MSGRRDRTALALVVFATALAAIGLALAADGKAANAPAVAFVVVALAAGCACLLAWASGARGERTRLPLLLMGVTLPAFGAFAFAALVDESAAAVFLVLAGVAGVALTVLILLARRG